MNTCFITPMKHRLLVSLLLLIISGSTVSAAAPTITSFSPLSGTASTEVTISGTGFSTTTSENTVFFGTLKAMVKSSSATQLVVTPPQGFANEKITVWVDNLGATSTQYFLYTGTYNCAVTQHSFAPKVDFASGNLPYSIANGDIDGDGDVDLAVSNLMDGTISIYQNASSNNMDASFFTTTTLTIGAGINLTTVLLEDLDGDKKPELIVTSSYHNSLYIFPNITTIPGSILFGTVKPITLTYSSAIKFAVSDLDLDSKPDLIVANTTAGSVSLFRNISIPGGIDFEAPFDVVTSRNPTAITTGDLNRDGKPEIIVSCSGETNVKIILNNGSSGGFNRLSFEVSNSLSANGGTTSDVKLADIDGDGLLDIIIANSGSNASLTVFKNTLPQGAKGAYPPVFEKAGNFAAPDVISNIAIGDFNGDKWPDIAATTRGSLNNVIAIYLNTLKTTGTIDAATFAAPVKLDAGYYPGALTLADFDLDDKIDIALTNSSGMSVLNRLPQNTPPSGSLSLGNGVTSVIVCPLTEVPVKLQLSGEKPWTIIYQIDGSRVYETITDIMDPNYEFKVTPEKTVWYQVTHVSDAQQCNSFVKYPPNLARITVIPTPVIKPNTIPNAALGSTYTQTLTLEPDETPLNWTVSSGLPDGLSFTNGLISGKPTVRNTYSFTVKANFTDCPGIKQYHMLCTDYSTTWNGTSWSNGLPDNTKDAIIDGNYNTALNDPFSCYHLVVNESDTLFVKDKNSITVAGNAINNGIIHKDCSVEIAITGTFAGTAVKIIQPQILPAFLSSGLINLAYSQPLKVSIGESPTYTVTNSLPTGLALANATIQGTPAKAGRYDFSIHSSEYSGACEASGNFSIFIEAAAPNLKFPANGITKTTGTAPFVYTGTTRSSGAITYSIEPAGACASIDAATGQISISCGGPVKQYTITAIQEAAYIYTGDTATTILTIEKIKPDLHFLKMGYLLGSTTGNTIQYQTASTGTVSIFQIDNNNTARVTSSGVVTPIAAGTFTFLFKIAETAHTLALDTLVTMGVYSTFIPPLSTSPTVVLEIGQDTIINVLSGSQGITGAIDASLTDIDTENTGVQYKFFSTKLGNFTIDNTGNVTILPFSGFIGTAQIGYVLTDENGTTSDVYYINITVNPPYVIPDLKANEVMTPNNDGLNDNLVIAYTDISKENALTILDETGTTVYTVSNYQNDWYGTSNKGTTLEPGVYFYAFTEKYSGRTLNGYIQIVK